MSKKPLVERVLGITDPGNADTAWLQAYATLVGRPYQEGDIEYPPVGAASLESWMSGLSRTQQERHQAMAEVRDLIGRNVISTNSLVDWPIYQKMMDEYGTKATGPAKALMIGALSSISTRSFVCLANEIYGADTAIVVDPEYGEDKARHGTFVRASGLELPFADNSIDFIHTNQLLHMLIDPSSDGASQSNRIRRLVREIARVLAPGGQIFMKEIIPDHESCRVDYRYDASRAARQRKTVTQSIAGALGRHGIEYVRVAEVPLIEELDFLFDANHQNQAQQAEPPSPFLFGIYAQKRPHRPIVVGS